MNTRNLQNIPSSSTYANLIKGCFEPKPGWLFGGSDFDSLEDKINALLTHDPNKIGVYTQGYDGHCLRAKAYFGDSMPDIKRPEGRRVFRINQENTLNVFFEGDIILYKGKPIKIEEYYDTYC